MAQFKLIPHWACASARENIGRDVVEQMAFRQVLGHTAVRCRQCGNPIPAGEAHVAFYHNFTEWRRWMFTAHIHQAPCASPTHAATACHMTARDA